MPGALARRQPGPARRVVRPAPPHPVAEEELARAAADLVDAVRGVVQALRGSSRGAEQELGVHGAELHVLRKLADGPAASLAELSARTRTDPSTTSVVVSGLEARGLVTRTVDPVDRRRTPLAITSAGRRVIQRAPEAAHARVARAAGPLGPDDLGALAGELGALAERLARARGR